ncbi:MAG: hypothetical protein EKK55_07735 [Rhodocyclaceae bacterium]|nr:MAG: hypothetical protein EKK55_07735 [Rhodocyclaceae bacterium]
MALIASPRRYFSAYTFVLLLNAGPHQNPRLRSPRSVFADPFTGDVWIGEMHEARGEMLADALRKLDAIHRELHPDERPMLIGGERVEPGLRHADVWMIQPHAQVGRVITVNFERWRSVPITLSAESDDVAMEWIRLSGATYLPARDVPEPELPPNVRAMFFEAQTRA